MSIDIEPARHDDLEDVLALLARHQLPPEGLRDHLGTTLVAKHSGRIVGSAALELYSDGALLRSVAVVPEMQGRGVGFDLTTAAIRLARDRRAATIYLLTTTAENYFSRLGFERIPRADVPMTVRASVEFTSACPVNATVMRKPI